METQARVERYGLSATIRIAGPERDADGTAEGFAWPPPAVPAPEPAPGARDLAEGESAELPVFTSSYPLDPDADSISASLTYSPSVAVSGKEPKSKQDFGTTWGNHIRSSGGRISRDTGVFKVTLTYENPIVIKVYKDTGPRGQVDIASESDPDIDAGNYGKVASDLTPGSDDRPPRQKFWARDLTLVHEQFHATDGQKFCKAAVAAEEAALNKQTAATMDEVKQLLKDIPDRIIQARAAGMTPPASEDRAYADGAPLYKARADAIRTQGKAGKYPAP
ncbi:MAG TPA: hypothetical protein VFG43_05310 [Geminicoccaceae bacterium]|nr:hypothetical protein [Geminicoccaceae bacterium]